MCKLLLFHVGLFQNMYIIAVRLCTNMYHLTFNISFINPVEWYWLTNLLPKGRLHRTINVAITFIIKTRDILLDLFADWLRFCRHWWKKNGRQKNLFIKHKKMEQEKSYYRHKKLYQLNGRCNWCLRDEKKALNRNQKLLANLQQKERLRKVQQIWKRRIQKQSHLFLK